MRGHRGISPPKESSPQHHCSIDYILKSMPWTLNSFIVRFTDNGIGTREESTVLLFVSLTINQDTDVFHSLMVAYSVPSKKKLIPISGENKNSPVKSIAIFEAHTDLPRFSGLILAMKGVGEGKSLLLGEVRFEAGCALGKAGADSRRR